MRSQWLNRVGGSSLTLVFAGWALGSAPFQGLHADKDILLVNDYTRLDTPLPALARYTEITLVAFSFGVASAVHWMAQSGLRPARSIAISGTLSPADPQTGIAPDMVRATADKLSPDSFARFCRRAGLNTPPPQIDIAAARAELHAIIARGPAPQHPFDRIWIPAHDRIIPTAAQEAAWAASPLAIRRVPGPHIPFRDGQSWAEWCA